MLSSEVGNVAKNKRKEKVESSKRMGNVCRKRLRNVVSSKRKHYKEQVWKPRFHQQQFGAS